MRELEGAWPALARSSRRAGAASADSQSPHSASYPPLSPTSPASNSSFFTTSPNYPRHATFEPWSSEEESEASDSGDDQGNEGDDSEFGCGSDGGDTESDGSSVHTPESGHSIAYGHALETSSSSTSSYFTCSDEAEVQEILPVENDVRKLPPSPSHIRGAAQSSPLHSRTNSTAAPPLHARRASAASQRQAKKEEREAKRAQQAAKAEHTAFARMTARLRAVLLQGEATRGLVQMQRDECERVREARGVRRGWLDGRRGKMAGGGGGGAPVVVQVFRPSGLGRGVWGPADVVQDQGEFEEDSSSSEAARGEDRPPAYEDVVAQGFPQQPGHAVHRTRSSQPIQRRPSTLAQLDVLEVDADLEHLELDPGELEGLDIDVDLEHLDLGHTLDVEDMGLDIEVDMDFRNVDVFAGGGGKGRRVPVRGKGRREVLDRRRMVAI